MALACGLPALSLWILTLVVGDWLVESAVIASLPQELREASGPVIRRFLSDAETLSAGGTPTIEVTPALEAAAERFGRLRSLEHWAGFGGALGLGLVAAALAFRRIDVPARTRQPVERVILVVIFVAAALSILTTVGIVFSVLFEAVRFFGKVPFFDFLFGLKWSPQIALREDQVGSSGAFGAVPLFVGTLLVTFVAMLVAGPVGLLSAIYLAEYADPRFRAFAKPMLEVLAGIPTVVYGFFAAPDRGAGPAQRGHDHRSGRRVRERPRRGAGHGHHDHSLCLVAHRRRPCRGAQGAARCLPGGWARPARRR